MTVMHAEWIKKYADGVALEFRELNGSDRWIPVRSAALFDRHRREFREAAVDMATVGDKFVIGGSLYLLARTGANHAGLVRVADGALLAMRSIPLPAHGVGVAMDDLQATSSLPIVGVAMDDLQATSSLPIVGAKINFSRAAQD